ncbi:MAG: DnaJ domain-containing protein [Pseudomonadota bacterium]
MRTNYDILGITPQAPAEIVSAVYRAWMKALKVHPDLGGDEELAKEINAAYDILRDPGRRAVYDAELKRSASSPLNHGARRAPRSEVDSPIAYCQAATQEWHSARAVDASVLGLKFVTDEELLVGMHLAVAFPGSTSPAVEADVRWARAASNGFEVGVEFFEPVPNILNRLRAT